MVAHNVRVTIVVGVDGSGRTHRLNALASAGSTRAVRAAASGVADAIATARSDASLLVVDDAHLLADDELRSLAAAAAAGLPMVMSRRPTLDREALASLDGAVLAAGGEVEALQPLTATDIANLARDVAGTRPDRAQIEWILAESCGLPAVAATLVTTAEIAAKPSSEPTNRPAGDDRAPGSRAAPAALVARVQRQLARAGPDATRVCRVLSLRLALPDGVIGAAARVQPDALPRVMRLLRDSGLLAPDGELVVPAVARAVLSDMSGAELRRVRSDIADALRESGAEPLVAAELLRAARVLSPAAADLYVAAGERSRFVDPEASLAWFDDAAESGADPERIGAGRAEAASLLGQPVDLDAAGDRTRLDLVAGAVEAHHGRAERAAAALAATGSVGALLAVPSLVGLGRLSDARDIAEAHDGPIAIRRLVEAALALLDPAAALAQFIEAAEAIERTAPANVLPDTPQALGAILAVAAGDVATADRLLSGALESGVGGPVADDRHRLLRGWAHMRAGRYDIAHLELRRTEGRRLPGRERLVRAALAAGIARRSGDIATMRVAWEHAEPALVRGAIDLFHLECAEELVVAAARLGRPHRASAVLDALEEIVQRLGSAPYWQSALAWIYLQQAIALDDPALALAAAQRVPDGGSVRVTAHFLAAHCWARVLAGTVESDGVRAAADALDSAELPWEASRLAGQAAIRTDDPDLARQLLERARAFTQRAGEPTDMQQPGQLTDREHEVARLVLAGRTHKEIGAQLFVSPKTVEHHVARIRSKLGVRTRAELMAALREIFPD